MNRSEIHPENYDPEDEQWLNRWSWIHSRDWQPDNPPEMEIIEHGRE
jgi:hypothetical protein